MPIFLLPTVAHQRIPNGIGQASSNFLMLWDVETTEAGSGSLSGFLEKRALNFEKANKGIFIIVKKLTPEQLILQLENGYLPDMISFGLGVGDMLVSKLIPYSGTVAVRRELAEAGELDGRQQAVAWSMGGYVLAARDEVVQEGESVLSRALSSGQVRQNKNTYSLTLGGVNNVSLLALLNADKTLQTGSAINPFHPNIHSQTQYEAYADFVSSVASNILLGSQRDYSRLLNREKAGSMEACTYEFLGGFSDIVNYMGITASDTDKHAVAVKFIEYLTSASVQALLPSIGMFSVNGLSYHTEEGYRKYEKALSESLKTINVFTSASRINELKELSLSALKGQESALKALSNYC